MIWGEETGGSTERFAARLLEGPRRLDWEGSAVLGVAASAPQVDAQAASGGLAGFSASLGESTWSRRLAPRHRDAVRTFFSRGDR